MERDRERLRERWRERWREGYRERWRERVMFTVAQVRGVAWHVCEYNVL